MGLAELQVSEYGQIGGSEKDREQGKAQEDWCEGKRGMRGGEGGEKCLVWPKEQRQWQEEHTEGTGGSRGCAGIWAPNVIDPQCDLWVEFLVFFLGGGGICLDNFQVLEAGPSSSVPPHVQGRETEQELCP